MKGSSNSGAKTENKSGDSKTFPKELSDIKARLCHVICPSLDIGRTVQYDTVIVHNVRISFDGHDIQL